MVHTGEGAPTSSHLAGGCGAVLGEPPTPAPAPAHVPLAVLAAIIYRPAPRAPAVGPSWDPTLAHMETSLSVLWISRKPKS